MENAGAGHESYNDKTTTTKLPVTVWSVLFGPYGSENLRSIRADYLMLSSFPSFTNISRREWAMNDFAKLDVNVASDYYLFIY